MCNLNRKFLECNLLFFHLQLGKNLKIKTRGDLLPAGDFIDFRKSKRRRKFLWYFLNFLNSQIGLFFLSSDLSCINSFADVMEKVFLY